MLKAGTNYMSSRHPASHAASVALSGVSRPIKRETVPAAREVVPLVS